MESFDVNDSLVQQYAVDILGQELLPCQVDMVKAWLCDGTVIVNARRFGRQSAYRVAVAMRKDRHV